MAIVFLSLNKKDSMHNNFCIKCNSNDWGCWASTTTGKIHRYCKPCRRKRADSYSARKKKNGGYHTKKEWLALLEASTECAICGKAWDSIPRHPDKRYKYVWTKDHKLPLSLGGNDDISNIQAVCYRCNSSKCNRISTF